MRISPRFCSRAGLLALAIGSASVVGGLGAPDIAHASGPVERMVQVLLHPTDPKVVVVRWGAASEGYLFSRDGGHTFKAMCSAVITHGVPDANEIRVLSPQDIPGAAATLIDTKGKLVVSQTDGLWSDDGTGCSWTKQLPGLWPWSIKRDPKLPEELVAIVTKLDSAAMPPAAETRLMRRDASGTWPDFSAGIPLVKPAAMQRSYPGDLLVSSTASGTQMYAVVQVATGAITAPTTEFLVGSTDGGKTWSDPVAVPKVEKFVLLAIDPNEPKRILAAEYGSSAPDKLVLSEDSGKTWNMYAEVQETSGVTFAPDGRLFIGDAGDAGNGTSVDGLWTAEKLGAPLTLVAGSGLLTCAQFDPTSKKLFTCKGNTFGLTDPTSGAFEKLIDFSHVPALIDCPGLDVSATCKDNFNHGASWCCTGHYPCSPFCSAYDVTMLDGRPAFCGLTGRAYDVSIGLTCEPDSADAGVSSSLDGGTVGSNKSDAASEPDAKVTHADASASHPDANVSPQEDPNPSNGGGGCDCAVAGPSSDRSGSGLLGSVGILLAVLWRSQRRRRS